MPFNQHPCFITPPDDTVIYKYINFYKFVSLINKSQIFFCRADKFPDPMEGCYPRELYKWSLDDWKNIYRPTFNKDELEKVGEDSLEKIAKSHWQLLRDFAYKIRGKHAICSFCSNEHEYEALWKLYSDIQTGICIRSTIGSLKKAIQQAEPNIYIGKVKYYSANPKTFLDEPLLDNLLRPYVLKQKEYEIEKEVRAIVCDKSLYSGSHDISAETGVFVNISLSDFIEEIILSPGSNKEFKEEISSMIKNRGLFAPITKSNLYELPF